MLRIQSKTRKQPRMFSLERQSMMPKEKSSVLTQAAGVTLKAIQSIDYSWGQINFEVAPMNGMLMAEECMAAPMADAGSYDMDIEPDDIEVSDTVTVVWEIE